jgi:hypothetical protein
MTNGTAAPVASWRPFAGWLLAFAALCLPLVLTTAPSNYSSDEATYYLPAIQQIRAHWPALDLRADSLSATAPGYPWLLAGVSLITGPSPVALRVANWLVSACVLALLWGRLRAAGGLALTLALAPLALSNFFVKSASWIVTDNAALLLTTAALLLVLFAPRPAGLAGAAAATALNVMVRQANFWLAAPLAVGLWRHARATRRAGWLLLLAVPAVPLLALLTAWGGLVPPQWRDLHLTAVASFGAPAVYLLAVLATLGPAFYFAAVGRADWREDLRSPWPATGALLGLAVAALTMSTPDMDAGRWGGFWWALAAHVPDLAGRSVVFLALAPLGGLMAGLLAVRLCREAGGARALTWLAAAGAWAASTLANRIAFHRYFEPPLLVLLVCWLALIAGARPDFRLALRWPLIALAAGQLLLTLATAHAHAFGLIRFV